MLAILGIGPLEWIVLLGGAVLLFGGDLPEALRKAARLVGRLRATARDLAREIDLTDPGPIDPAEEPWPGEEGVDAEKRLGPPLDMPPAEGPPDPVADPAEGDTPAAEDGGDATAGSAGETAKSDPDESADGDETPRA